MTRIVRRRISSLPRIALENVANNDFLMIQDVSLNNTYGMLVRDARELFGQPTLYVNDGGAEGDGISDDTAALQSVLTAGGILVLSPYKRYLITSQLEITQDYTGIEGNGALIELSTESGHFDNTLYANRYATNALGIIATSRDGVFVRNCRITLSAYVDPSRIGAIAFNTCNDIDISGNELYGFSRSFLITINDCQRGTIRGNYIHDCWTNTPYEADGITLSNAAEVQITGMYVDGDAAIGSQHIEISGNRIFNLTVSWDVIVSTGFQTDAINLQGNNLKPSRGFKIFGNSIYNVGDGTDIFGNENVIYGNVYERCFGSALKLIHGASRNEFHGNIIKESGYCGVLMGGSSSATSEYGDNSIRDNQIIYVNRAINWLGADGNNFWTSNGTSTYWSDAYNANNGTGTAGIRIDVAGSYQINRTYINDNLMILGEDSSNAAGYGVMIEAGDGIVKTKHYLRDNDIRNWKTGKYSDNGDRLWVAPSRPQRVRLTSNYRLSNTTSDQPALINTFPVTSGTSWRFRSHMQVSGLSGSTNELGFGITGNATFTTVAFGVIGKKGGGRGGASYTNFTTNTTQGVTGATTETAAQLSAEGILVINVGGYIVPSVQMITNSAAANVLSGSYFEIWEDDDVGQVSGNFS
jgi:hypothetical protein